MNITELHGYHMKFYNHNISGFTLEPTREGRRSCKVQSIVMLGVTADAPEKRRLAERPIVMRDFVLVRFTLRIGVFNGVTTLFF